MTSKKEFNHNGIYMGLLILLIYSLLTSLLHSYFMASFFVESRTIDLIGPALVGLSLFLYFVNWILLKIYLNKGTKKKYTWLSLSLAFWAIVFLSYFSFMIFMTLNGDLTHKFRIIIIFTTLAFVNYQLFKVTFVFLKELKIEFDRLNTIKNYF